MSQDFLVRAVRDKGKPISWCYSTRKEAIKAFDTMKKTGKPIDGDAGQIVSLMAFDGADNVIGRWHRDHETGAA